MKDLIRNCQHYGCHYTYLLRKGDGEIKAVEKKTFAVDGVSDLNREVEGLRWYCQKIGKSSSDIIESFEKTQKYCKLIIKYHHGELISNAVNPELVKDKIQMAVEHYLEVFGSDNFEFSHGDYFIGNIVYNDNKVAWVIDWEHFNNELPAGYDAVNCIVEVFLSSYNKRTLYSKSSIELAKNLLSKISESLDLSKAALKSPAAWCRETALNHKDIWGFQYCKLPPIACPYQRCAEIDRLIGI